MAVLYIIHNRQSLAMSELLTALIDGLEQLYFFQSQEEKKLPSCQKLG
jgi:hypothetical protein